MLHCTFVYTLVCVLFKACLCYSSLFESLGQDLLGSCLKLGDEDHTVITVGVLKLSGLEQMLQILKTELGSSNIGGGEGNGNSLQYSCLENPMDGGAWWAAVYGVAQSRT